MQAQDAHEAVRPASVTLAPQVIHDDLTNDQFRLYDLIWRRAGASQMASAVFLSTTVDLSSGEYLFRVNGIEPQFEGFQAVFCACIYKK